MKSLLDKRLLIVTGKGGTGKSAITAALALLGPREGKRTLVCEINGDERVTQLLGMSPAGPEISQRAENLWTVNIQPPAAMREYALMRLRLESIYKAVFENRFVRYFLRFIPSLQELVMLGKALYHLEEKLPDGSYRFEMLVLDAPATGHAISFLSLPAVLSETVPPGAMHREVERMRALLEDEAVTAVALVTLPEEMPVNETLDLAAALVQRQLHPQVVVLNAFTAARFAEADLAALRGKPRLLAIAEEHRLLAQSSEEARATLAGRLHLPVLTIDRLYPPRFGREQVERIASQLGEELKALR
jgi:anion-transporting  ArsA/GET3 family ATPase